MVARTLVLLLFLLLTSNTYAEDYTFSIWVSKNFKVPGLTHERSVKLVYQAARHIDRHGQNIKFVKKPYADIVVRSRKIDDGDHIGECWRTTPKAIYFDSEFEWTEHQFKAIAVHEILHSLLQGHVDDPTSVMHPAPRVAKMSVDDIRRLNETFP